MIEVQNISFAYGKQNVLRHVSFTLDYGMVLGILGNNGAGKSTLITCLNKILRPNDGRVLLDDVDILKMGRMEMARLVAYVPQKAETTQSTVYDTALLGRRPYIKWSMSQEDLDICDRVMEQLGIASIKLRPINELSGGEVQKVMLARALVQQPKLLLLDEPTSNLDPRNQHEIMNLIHNMAKEQNFAVITVIHDLNLAARYCDRFLFMKDGTVFSYGGADAMTRDTIKSVYGIDAHIMECSGMPVIVPFLNLT